MKKSNILFWYKKVKEKKQKWPIRMFPSWRENWGFQYKQGCTETRRLKAVGLGGSGCRKHSCYSSGVRLALPNKSIGLRAPLWVTPLLGLVWCRLKLALHDLEHQGQTPQYQIHPRRGLWERTGVWGGKPSPIQSYPHNIVYQIKVTSPIATLSLWLKYSQAHITWWTLKLQLLNLNISLCLTSALCRLE